MVSANLLSLMASFLSRSRRFFGSKDKQLKYELCDVIVTFMDSVQLYEYCYTV